VANDGRANSPRGINVPQKVGRRTILGDLAGGGRMNRSSADPEDAIELLPPELAQATVQSVVAHVKTVGRPDEPVPAQVRILPFFF